MASSIVSLNIYQLAYLFLIGLSLLNQKFLMNIHSLIDIKLLELSEVEFFIISVVFNVFFSDWNSFVFSGHLLS